MVPVVDRWELTLPNGVLLTARIALARHQELRNRFRWYVIVNSPVLGHDMRLPASLHAFGMPPEHRADTEAIDDARAFLRLLGFVPSTAADEL